MMVRYGDQSLKKPLRSFTATMQESKLETQVMGFLHSMVLHTKESGPMCTLWKKFGKFLKLTTVSSTKHLYPQAPMMVAGSIPMASAVIMPTPFSKQSLYQMGRDFSSLGILGVGPTVSISLEITMMEARKWLLKLPRNLATKLALMAFST